MCIHVNINIDLHEYAYKYVYKCKYIDRNLCQDTCFLSGVKKQDFTNQKSKISGRYDEFAHCDNRQHLYIIYQFTGTYASHMQNHCSL